MDAVGLLIQVRHAAGLSQALATVSPPLHLEWSTPKKTYRLSDRRERARLYEIVLREGGPEDMLAYVDGALLIDLWSELVLPSDVRTAPDIA